MRLLKAALLSIVGLALASPVQQQDVSERSIDKRANPSISGLKFTINGVNQYFAGTNSYWIGFLTNNADVDLVMSHLKSSGLKVLRIWGNSPLHLNSTVLTSPRL